MTRRGRQAEAGFTLAEMLAATAIVAVGLLAVALALQYALSGIEVGRGETAATFLAEDKLEALKSTALIAWDHPSLAAATTTEFCLPTGDDCSPMPRPGSYRRSTTVTPGLGGTCAADCKIVRVTVFYNAVTGEGQMNQERRLDVVTLFAART